MISDLVIWYLFLAGAGGGALLLTCVLELLTPEALPNPASVRVGATDAGGGVLVRRAPVRSFPSLTRAALPCTGNSEFGGFFATAYTASVAVLALSIVFLFADLGRPDRVLALFLHPSTSLVSAGAFILTATVLTAMVPLLLWRFGLRSLPLGVVWVARVLCILCCAATLLYSGVLLASFEALPFWNTLWLPCVFAVSSLSSSVGVLMAALVVCGEAGRFFTTLRRLKRLDALLIGLEVVLLAAFLLDGWRHGGTAGLSVESLLGGDVSLQFWLFVVVLGLAAPLALELFEKSRSQRLLLLLSCLILLGGFFLRWCIVGAGHPVDFVASYAASLML